MSSLDSLKLVSAIMEAEDRDEAFADIEWAINRIGQLEAALRLCIARAGVPDPLEACRLVIRTAEEALQKPETKP